MITRLAAEDLKELGFQLEAINIIIEHGGQLPKANTILTINKRPMCFIFWWQDGEKCLAEFLDFVPGEGPFKDFFGNEFICQDDTWDIKK